MASFDAKGFFIIFLEFVNEVQITILKGETLITLDEFGWYHTTLYYIHYIFN